MRQHFESEYLQHIELYKITPLTIDGIAIMTEDDCWIIDTKRDEITQGCINRIVDNLNKLAEYNARNHHES